MEAKIARKTATIERYHMYGTRHYSLKMTYKGYTWHEVTDHGNDSTEKLLTLARNRGFTHVKFVGNWDRRTKPKNGSL